MNCQYPRVSKLLTLVSDAQPSCPLTLESVVQPLTGETFVNYGLEPSRINFSRVLCVWISSRRLDFHVCSLIFSNTADTDDGTALLLISGFYHSFQGYGTWVSVSVVSWHLISRQFRFVPLRLAQITTLPLQCLSRVLQVDDSKSQSIQALEAFLSSYKCSQALYEVIMRCFTPIKTGYKLPAKLLPHLNLLLSDFCFEISQFSGPSIVLMS